MYPEISKCLARSGIFKASGRLSNLTRGTFAEMAQLVERPYLSRNKNSNLRKKNKTKTHFAEIAQLVEHNLAKVGVASSSLVFRSLKELALNMLTPFSFTATPYSLGVFRPKEGISGQMFYQLLYQSKDGQ